MNWLYNAQDPNTVCFLLSKAESIFETRIDSDRLNWKRWTIMCRVYVSKCAISKQFSVGILQIRTEIWSQEA